MTEPTTLPAELLPWSCATCRFWAETVREGGECRRYPLLLSETRWPVTKQDDWCGEYRRNPNENAEVSP